ncbi:carbohydrate ABC transporter permease [Parablautia intestinalis]|jgi:raffinose/stachyose/melibiose transport system permease protein|uniref:Carbohydrate ABC transporter permease n=1 Tax=Parablautia intestinalis TaxID=2320100 RepID=A0A3A9AQA5_9FIRM|nr:carbohydrate ABC transporter permease [Parablautia intestinalis]MCI8616375.1 carbohydrate ABC transporter permease [Lachnospiraceae bacterium]RKI93710.1 carbohydrate ABC transporter permease [Parablautia intestinalis]
MNKLDKLKRYAANFIVNVPIMILSLTCIFPVVWLLYSSVKTDVEFNRSPVSLPSQIHLDNYIAAFNKASFGTFTFNSLFNSVLSLLLVLIISFIMGYLLSRYRFKGRNLIYGALMAAMMIPIYALLVPIFIQEKQLGLLNTRFSLIPIYVAVELPTAVFLIDSYIRGISVDMEDAASIDGASLPRIMFTIIMPICKPILSTIVILTFMHVWNEFAFAQVLISKEALKTIPIGLTYFTTQYSTSYTLLLAALAMATIPVLVIYLFFYNKIMEGMMAGAIKG